MGDSHNQRDKVSADSQGRADEYNSNALENMLLLASQCLQEDKQVASRSPRVRAYKHSARYSNLDPADVLVPTVYDWALHHRRLHSCWHNVQNKHLSALA